MINCPDGPLACCGGLIIIISMLHFTYLKYRFHGRLVLLVVLSVRRTLSFRCKTHTRARVRKRTHTHARAQTHTHTHTHAHARTHEHTHGRACGRARNTTQHAVHKLQESSHLSFARVQKVSHKCNTHTLIDIKLSPRIMAGRR